MINQHHERNGQRVVKTTSGGRRKNQQTRKGVTAPYMLLDFRNLTYIVPGADRIDGVSGQLVQLLALCGANLLACGPKQSGYELVELCKEIKRSHGVDGTCIFQRGDCSNTIFARWVAKRAIRQFGGIHGLAPLGIDVPQADGGILDVCWEDCVATIKTNGGIVHSMIKAVVPQMRKQGLGRIVLANSKSATGYAGQTRYSLSKCLTRGFMTKMMEFARENVLTNSILLGPTPNCGKSWAARDRLHPGGRRGLAEATLLAAISRMQRLRFTFVGSCTRAVWSVSTNSRWTAVRRPQVRFFGRQISLPRPSISARISNMPATGASSKWAQIKVCSAWDRRARFSLPK